jgi:hypothetical protein
MLPSTLAAVYNDPGLGRPIDLTPQVDVFGVGAAPLAMWQNSLLINGGPVGWQQITGGLSVQFGNTPAAVSRPPRVDVFGVTGGEGVGGAMYHNWYTDSEDWAGWQSLGIAIPVGQGLTTGFFTSPPAAVSWGPNRLDVFGVAADQGMYHNWSADGTQFQENWTPLGGSFTSAPAAVSWGPNRLDVFGVGDDYAMYHTWWDGDLQSPHWADWQSLGGSFDNPVGTSPPAVVSRGLHLLDVFAVWEDNTIRYNGWDPSAWSGWSGWQSLKGSLTGAPAAVSWGPNRLDVFGVSANNSSMYHNSSNCVVQDGQLLFQADWDLLDGRFQFTSAPAAVSWGEGLLAVFGVGWDTTGSEAGGALYNVFDQGWADWQPMPGSYPAP